jgi:hypothetical protein
VLMEELFSRGIMTMGPSATNPEAQAGIFVADFVSRLPARRAAKMKKFAWLAGEWRYENHVPAGRLNPPYTDEGVSRYSLRESDSWICSIAPDGRETPHITFDPFSEQWIYLLMRGSYGLLRSREGWQDERLIFSGLMTMIGIDTEWRMTWSKAGNDRFSFMNEERLSDGSWGFIDDWRFFRIG